MNAESVFPLSSFKFLLEASPTAIAISRLSDGVFVEVNDAFVLMTGYSRAELIGQTGQSLGLWRRSDERRRMLLEVKERGHVHHMAHEFRRKSGELGRAVVSAHHIDLDGTPYLLGFLTDLGELDDARTALLNGEARLNYAERLTRIGFWDWDVAAARIYWSPGLEALFGLEEGGFKGTYADFVCRVFPEDVLAYEKARDAAIANRAPFEHEFRIVRDDGTLRWQAVRCSFSYAADGRLLRASGFNIDVTDAKRHEQQLRLLAEVMSNMAEGVALISVATGQVVYANPRYEKMFRYGPGELVGVAVAKLNSVGEHGPVEVANAIIDELKRTGSWHGEVGNRRKDGSTMWCRSSVSTFDHADYGRVWVDVKSDITEERLAQCARAAAYAELHRLSASMQETIEAERRALSRDVHDQIGAALTGLHMKLEALARQPETGAGLRHELLSLARMAQAALVSARTICTRLRPPILDDLGLVETCRWYVRDWAQTSGVRVRSRFRRLAHDPDMALACDLFRILQELLTNVARHARASTVRVSLSGGVRSLRLCVADDGRGFQAAAVTPGLGLAGVRERAAHFGGRVSIRSDASGTTVAVTLTLSRGASA